MTEDAQTASPKRTTEDGPLQIHDEPAPVPSMQPASDAIVSPDAISTKDIEINTRAGGQSGVWREYQRPSTCNEKTCVHHPQDWLLTTKLR